MAVRTRLAQSYSGIKCSVAECDAQARKNGMCQKHNFRWKALGNPTAPYKRIPSYKGVKCSVVECETQARHKGKCSKHYAQDRRTPEWATERRAKDLAVQEKAMGRPRPEFCEICNGPPNDRWGVLHFDHDHTTGKPRGWTCRNCNVMMGLAKDSVDRLLDLAAYLEKHNANR